ncbi:TPA: fibronectin type III domain-containing protein [Bacillus pacificus]
MRIKKCFAIFSLMMIMCLSVLPSFASAEEKDYLKGVKGYFGGSNLSVSNITDGNPGTFDDIGGFQSLYFNFDKPVDDIRVIYIRTNNISDFADAQMIFSNSKGNAFKQYKIESLIRSDNYLVLPEEVKDVKQISISNKNKHTLRIYDFKALNYDLPLQNITDLNSVIGINDAEFTWKNPVDIKFTGVKIYKDGQLLVTLDKDKSTYKAEGLEGNKNYMFNFVAVYGDRDSNGMLKGIKTLVDPKTVPPSPVASLVAEPTDKTVKLKWKSPKDDDLAGFKILQNGKQIAEIGLEEEFTVKNLQPLTDYNFGVIAVDRDKNDSSPVNLSVKTLEENDEEPPHVPSNVFAKPSNGALIATWDKVSDKDLAGYNVYVDDKKVNSNLVSSTNFTIKNLENNRKYKIQVQAVDRSGNASALSLAAYGTPDEKTLPIIESKYSLQDVSDGVSVMFGQFWTVLAFAVGIPLAFYIIYKLKLTVLP